VTGRKLAKPAPLSVRTRFGLDPRDGARIRVALLAESETSVKELLAAASFFVDSPEPLGEVAGRTDELTELWQRIGLRGEHPFARALRVNHLRAPEHNGYPLRRTQLVVFNRRKGQVTASFSEVAGTLKIMGIGTDEATALSDLERQFDYLVRDKVRIPPHARKERDDPIRLIVNHLVDWVRFEQESPLPRALWGQIVKRPLFGRPTVRWLLGPGGIRKETTSLTGGYNHPRLTTIPKGKWFRAVVKEYPDRIEWVEPPYQVPDPEDEAERRKAWAAIPAVLTTEEGVWPQKED
jgi:hypothetical protein